MDRRSFVKVVRDSISGSFVLGAVGGAAVGGGGVALYDRREPGHVSYAQQGEDLIVANLLEILKITKPTYLDVGAYDPILHSNTYLLYTQGGRGVLVEPNPARTKRLADVRPRDKTLNIGIGITPGLTSADYYVIGGPSKGLFNTFSKADAELVQTRTQGEHFIEKVLKMPLENINSVIDRNFPSSQGAPGASSAPNFLSIDTEGLDLNILKTMDFERHRPDVICVETLDLGSDHVDMEIVRFLESKRYSVRGATFVNTIFVDDRHLTQPGPLSSPPRDKPA